MTQRRPSAPEGFRYCTNCTHFVPAADFSKNIGTFDGLTTHCKTCANQKASQYGKQKYREFQAFLRNIALRKGGVCSFEGCPETEGLHFDHRVAAEKSFDVSQGFALHRTNERIEEEANKCSLLCRVHHRLRTNAQHRDKQIRGGPKTKRLPSGETQECASCGQHKDINLFSTGKRKQKGLSTCRTCVNKENKRKGHVFQNAFKTKCCVEGCNWTDPEVLEFDHIPERGPKLFNVSSQINMNRERLRAEISKCQTPCANCHERISKIRLAHPDLQNEAVLKIAAKLLPRRT